MGELHDACKIREPRKMISKCKVKVFQTADTGVTDLVTFYTLKMLNRSRGD